MSVQIRRDPAATWTAADVTLAEGEMGCESDTGKIKVGDGSLSWTKMGYAATTLAGPVLGSTQGFHFGGATAGNDPTRIDTINKYAFASDGNATDHGNLRAPATHTKGASNIKGSTIYNIVAVSYYGETSVDKFSATSNTTATTSPVTLTTQLRDGGGIHSPEKGYYLGGKDRNIINRFPFAAEGNCVDTGDLTTTTNWQGLSTCSNKEDGYAMNGWQHPTEQGSVRQINKWPFASEGNAVLTGSLTTAFTTPAGGAKGAGGMSLTHGYIAGSGRLGSYTARNLIEKFPFAANANSTDVADLTTGRAQHTSSSSASYVYVAGGAGTNASPVTTVATIEKFATASDADATSVGNIQTASSHAGAGVQ